MKFLTRFADNNDLRIIPITYRFKGTKLARKGFDLVNNKDQILASFEPINDTSGNKWYLRNVHENYAGVRYVKRITDKFLNSNINTKASSFYVLKS